MPIPELTQTVVIDGKDVPWLREVESRGRTSHVHWDGCEVQRQLYCNHYWTAPHVCAALLGFVLRGVDGTGGAIFTRYLPAFDPIYDQILYCNEARWDHVDGDKKSISNASPIGGAAGNVTKVQAYSHFMFEINRVGENKVVVDNDGSITEGVPGGAFITASYRPLISAYRGPYGVLDEVGRHRQFDFMDPVLTPGVQTIPWPDGLQLVKRGKTFGNTNPDNISGELADPITIPLIEFTIRRMFLGKVPHQRFSELQNTVNEDAWPSGQANSDQWPYTLPQFPAHTLRFDGYTETRHWSQSSNLNQWHEVEFHFSWRNYRDFPIMDLNGDSTGRTWVTWNHALANPFDADLAWYRVRRNSGLLFDGVGGEDLYTSSDFDTLFATISPASL